MSLNPVLNDNKDPFVRIKELSLEPSLFQASDRISTFDRSASFMEISHQTADNELSISARSDDTLLNKISPSINKRMTAVKHVPFTFREFYIILSYQ